MDIVYSSSDAYSECTGVSLYSLYLNNIDIEELNVNILSTDISEKNKEALTEVASSFNRRLNIIDAKQDFIDEANRLHLQLLRGAYNTYSRVVLNRWFSHLDKIMVIDSDTMVTGSIKGAWELDINESYLAAVPEIAMYNPYSTQEDPELIKSLDMYYNMGICVVNLKKWREDNIDNLIVTSIERNKPVFKIADQSIINKYCAGKIARLPLMYNFYSPVHNVSYKTVNRVFNIKTVFSEEEFEHSSKTPAIIHYFGHSYERPWFKYSVALKKNEYLAIRKETPWHNKKLGSWRKGGSIIIKSYDIICYFLLLTSNYEMALRFRYIWGQKVKNLIHKERL